MNIRSQRRTRRARRTRTKRAGRTRRTRRTRRTKRAGRVRRSRKTRRTKRTKRSRKTRRSRRVIYQSAGAEAQNLEDDDDEEEFFDALETPEQLAALEAEEIKRERLKADQVANAREQLAWMKAWEVEQKQGYQRTAAKRAALQIWRERAQGARYDGERTYDEIIAHQKEKQAKFRSDGGMTTAGLTHRNRRQGI
jgi:hypothetical protein